MHDNPCHSGNCNLSNGYLIILRDESSAGC